MKSLIKPIASARSSRSFAATGITFLAVIITLIQPLDAVALRTRDIPKFMVIGDSITHGHEGDYTWRYRLWEWLQSSNTTVDFVGPYVGTQPPDEPAPPSPPRFPDEPAPASGPRTYGGYALDVEEGFDSDHFAVWGRQAAQVKGEIAQMVSTYSPDYLLIAIGFNDLGWFVSGPEGTLESVKAIVDNARSVKSDIKFALANVPMRTYIGGRDDLPIITNEYNDLLVDAIPQWSTSTSPIALVQFRENYECELDSCPAGYDGLHPNALGEYQIAQAFSRALHSTYGFGVGELVIGEIPVRACPVPSNFVAASSPLGVTVTWDKVYTSFSYAIRSRVKGSDWSGSSSQTSNRLDTTWTVEGIEWEYQIMTNCGDTIKSDWSDIVSAVATPETPPGPTPIKTGPIDTGLTLTWEPPAGYSIDRYEVFIYAKDIPGSFLTSMAVHGNETSATWPGLSDGERYAVGVACWSNIGGGLPSFAHSVKVGRGAPAPPTNLEVFTRDSTTVKLNHSGDPNAAEYRFWTRDINNETDFLKPDASTVDGVCSEKGLLSPAAWDYEFCVSALNGDLESGLSNCVIASQDTVPDLPAC